METPSSNQPLPVPLDRHGPPRADGAQRRRRRKRASDHAPRSYQVCDSITGWLVSFLAIFTPWAFGSTDSWAVGLATLVSYALGGLLVAKLFIRRREEFEPARWGEAFPAANENDSGEEVRVRRRPPALGAQVIGFVHVALLAMMVLSLANAQPVATDSARATGTGGLWTWLPHTVDRGATLRTLAQFLGLVCAFWAIRDWLLYRSVRERKEAEKNKTTNTPVDPQAPVAIPARLRQLLWLLSINGALLAIVGYLQRAAGTPYLLWLFEAPPGQSAEAAFGPWPFRASAAHYFNLLWPVTLAFWLWMQERASRLSTSALARFDGPQIALIPCACFMAACPAVSGNRAATVLSLGVAAAAGLAVLFVSRREVSVQVRFVTLAGIIVAGIAALGSGWGTVRERLTRPDLVLPTAIVVGNDPFTLLVRLRMPPSFPKEWTPLVKMRGSLSSDELSRSGSIGISPEGNLLVQFLGDSPTDVSRKTCMNFAAQFAGRDVLVTLIRDKELRIFADGNEFGSIDGKSGDAPGWISDVGTRYLNVVSRSVSEVALLDAALRTDEVPTAARLALEKLGDRILGARSFIADGGSLTNGMILAPGVTAEMRPDQQWVLVRRPGSTGSLGFAWRMPTLDRGLRGAVRVSLTVQNTSSLPLYLAINVDGGEVNSVEVAPRSEQTVAARCRLPHDGTPRIVSVAVADRVDPKRGATLAPDSQILVRDLQLTPAAVLFARTLNAELKMGSMGDSAAGQPEIRDNARRMASDHFLWGSGAGTFATLYSRYAEPGQSRVSFAFDDWLEARLTLGVIGATLIAIGLLALFFRSWGGKGLPTIRVIVTLIWIGLGSAIISAASDFPFQVHSVLFLFTLVAAMATIVGRTRTSRRG